MKIVVMKKNIEKNIILKVALMLSGVALLQLALGGAYLAAFHAPKAHRVPIAVVGSSPQVTKLARSIDSAGQGAYQVTLLPSRDEAMVKIMHQKIYAAYIPGVAQKGTPSTVLVASAASQSLAQSIPDSFAPVSAALQTGQVVEDTAPLAKGDTRGLGIFYTAFTWVFGGYLAAAAIGITMGKKLFSRRYILMLCAGFAIFAAVTSLLVAVIAHGVNIIPDSGYAFWKLVAFGSLATFATALSASAVIALLGVAGTGIVILFFVIMGNPASDGVMPVALTGGGPWQWLAHSLPTGVGVDAIRDGLYFDCTGILRCLLIYAAYAIAGFAVLLAIARRTSSQKV